MNADHFTQSLSPSALRGDVLRHLTYTLGQGSGSCRPLRLADGGFLCAERPDRRTVVCRHPPHLGRRPQACLLSVDGISDWAHPVGCSDQSGPVDEALS
jgi:hypothetical protein